MIIRGLHICLIFVLVSFQKQDKLEAVIVNYLSAADNIEEVKDIYKIVRKHNKNYAHLTNYIPTIAPINPKKTKRLSSLFGNRYHPKDGVYKKHLGLDIAAPYGVPVHATASGMITKTVKSNKGYGNQVYIIHGFGFNTRYAHLDKIYAKKGQKIKKGDIIGFVGSTGKSTGSHLHYEVLKNRKHQDPQPYCFLEL